MAALYQRARPTTFAQLVGQDHVKDVLVSAVRRGRTGHAYLFSGPRGVGKTTSARLLAMAVNCDAAPELRPCGECESCRLVQAGSHPDVAELDAASHNSVDDIRDLRERVGLASLRGGTRVWILDEAHMLSKAAANALLKTLEEPPPGLMFILATTEPERLPPTILSRCQQFRFRRLSDDEITSKLERLCADAAVTAESAALALVARAADGGMRDAESLLERLLVSGEPVTLAGAEEALGLPPRERLLELMQALADDDLARLLASATALYRSGFAPRTLAEQLARALRDALLEQLNGQESLELDTDGLLRLLHALDDEQERFVRRGDLYSLEVALIKARNALRGNLPMRFEVERTLSGATTPVSDAPAPVARAGNAVRRDQAGSTVTPPSASPGRAATSGSAPPFDPKPSPARRTPAATPTPQDSVVTDAPADVEPAKSFSWHSLRGKASTQLKAFLMPVQADLAERTLTLTYQDTHVFHNQQLLKRLPELESLITAELGDGYKIVIDGPAGKRTAGSKKA